MRQTSLICGMIVLLSAVNGCVRRTLTINTEPQGAIVFLNDQEIGSTPVSRDFNWYGDYDVVIRKDGYQTLHTHIVTARPWYQIPPVDFFVDVFWPHELHDVHERHFVLEPWVDPSHEELIERAMELQSRALQDRGK